MLCAGAPMNTRPGGAWGDEAPAEALAVPQWARHMNTYTSTLPLTYITYICHAHTRAHTHKRTPLLPLTKNSLACSQGTGPITHTHTHAHARARANSQNTSTAPHQELPGLLAGDRPRQLHPPLQLMVVHHSLEQGRLWATPTCAHMRCAQRC